MFNLINYHPMKLKSFLKPVQFLCIACACLAAGACSDDDEQPQNPEPPTPAPTESSVLALSYTQIGLWFEGDVPQGTDKAVSKPAETDGIQQTEFYALSLGGDDDIAAELKTTKLNQANWVYNITVTDPENGISVFKAAAKEYLDDSHWNYTTAQYWNDEIMENNNGSPVLVTREEIDSKLADADYEKDSMRLGFLSEKAVVVVSIQQGIAEITVRPAYFHDNWIWYSQNLLDRDFNEVLNEYYFCVKSSGFIPPMFQIMIFDGMDRNNTPFNMVLFSRFNSPTERIEGAYTLDDPISYWLTILESPDTESTYGSFEQAFIFFKDNSNVITLNTARETADWVKANDMADVDYIMPIYRISDTHVTIPQLDSQGLTVIVSRLEAEQSANKAAVKTLHAK